MQQINPAPMNIRLPLFCLALVSRLSMHAAVRTDIEYGTAGGESLRLDASIPDGAGPFPAVILVHGGGWSAGDKSGGPQKGYMAPMQDPLSHAGFAWFSINYRLSPQFRHPAALKDLETAIRWLKAHAAEYRVDPRRIALAGESSGAHLVAFAAVRADDSTRVAAIVAFYGAYDLAAETKRRGALSDNLVKYIGRSTLDEQTFAVLHDVSPYNYVKPGLPPFLLLHGTADKNNSYQQSVDLQARLRAAGDTCDLITIKDGPHGMLPWPPLAPDFKDRVVAWLQAALQVPATRPSP
jgi:alpha-L-fucosidase 2